MISNDTYTKAVQDVLEFIDRVGDGDLDYITWKLRNFVEYGEDFNTKDEISMTYEVTLHRVVEHETTFRVKANSEEEAEELVLSGNYDEIVEDSEQGEMEDPDIIDTIKV